MNIEVLSSQGFFPQQMEGRGEGVLEITRQAYRVYHTASYSKLRRHSTNVRREYSFLLFQQGFYFLSTFLNTISVTTLFFLCVLMVSLKTLALYLSLIATSFLESNRFYHSFLDVPAGGELIKGQNIQKTLHL